MSNHILFVFEGEKTEKKITDNLTQHFVNVNTIIQCAYCTTIYNLYNSISTDKDLDTFELLKNIPYNKQSLSSFSRKDFAEIYLFFDYDGHTSSASDKKLKDILNLFNQETEFGKLYVSYPMVEALKHCSESMDFKELKAEAKRKTKYKQKVNLECDKKFINIPLYSKDIWIQLIGFHLKKMNYIVTSNYSFPTNTINQDVIFSNQLEKYINIDSTVAVLSSFPIFLFDYYGVKLISELFSDSST